MPTPATRLPDPPALQPQSSCGVKFPNAPAASSKLPQCVSFTSRQLHAASLPATSAVENEAAGTTSEARMMIGNSGSVHRNRLCATQGRKHGQVILDGTEQQYQHTVTSQRSVLLQLTVTELSIIPSGNTKYSVNLHHNVNAASDKTRHPKHQSVVNLTQLHHCKHYEYLTGTLI